MATSTGAADLQREREARYRQDREGWRARLRQYQGARHQPVNERDGWLSLDDPDEYDFMACRWPVLSGEPVLGEHPQRGRRRRRAQPRRPGHLGAARSGAVEHLEDEPGRAAEEQERAVRGFHPARSPTTPPDTGLM